MMRGRLACLGLALLLAGCTHLADEPRTPVPAAPAQWRNAAGAERDGPGAPWWRDYGDPQLDALVVRAQQANADVLIAGGRLALAQARLAAADATGAPALRADAGLARQQVPRQRTPDLDEAGQLVFWPLPPYRETRRRLGLTLAYEVDLFGRVARARAAGQARLDAAWQDREAVRLLVAREVVQAYAALRLAQAQAALQARRIGLARQLLADETARGRLGLSDRAARDAAEAQLDDALLAASATARAQAGAHAQLALLLGEEAAALQLPPAPLPASPLRVLPDLPASVLARRPDLQSAWQAVEAGRLGIEEARLQRFPRLNLTGSTGFASNALARFLRQDYLTWLLDAGVDWLLLDGGRTEAEVAAARAGHALALAEYRKAMLAALGEVEQALADWQDAVQADALAVTAQQRAARQLDDARRDHALGRNDRPALLLAEDRRLAADAALLERQARRIQAYAMLNAALAR
ncbi:TolC family protein [Chitiniphilus purpureus]|uniref:TolC family protein n=1 Tax=Chitiniphilus purpureus TaxID=2981137 RepID=A0ABY6DM75_9NEIS|nr:TolC family protein [Chitiniphilus sp. CD1]UXY15475.1 TolC family protein [Chitiniphilus sp. CD1]